MTSQDIESITITPQEEKELRRAFEKLCDFHIKQKLNKDIQDHSDRLAALQGPQQLQNGEGAKVTVTRTEAQIKQEEDRLNSELAELNQKLNAITLNPSPKIKAVDVSSVMASLGKKCTKKEIMDMVWEVDENLDGCVDWEEFRLMFHRNVSDKTGLEPSKLYNMVQFLMYDSNGNGLVSVDETMEMFYARYGPPKMEIKLKELFGDEYLERGTEGGEINFLQYLESVERTQLQAFLNTNVGKAQLAKMGKKMKGRHGKQMSSNDSISS